MMAYSFLLVLLAYSAIGCDFYSSGPWGMGKWRWEVQKTPQSPTILWPIGQFGEFIFLPFYKEHPRRLSYLIPLDVTKYQAS